MKIITIFLLTVCLLSCDKEDESTKEVTNKETKLITTNFLTNEFWQINSITSSLEVNETGEANTSSTNTLSQNMNCILDDTFQFTERVNNELLLVYSDNEEVCDNFEDKYGTTGGVTDLFIELSTNTEERITSMSIKGGVTFPGLFCSCSTLNNVEGDIDIDGNKTLKASIQTIRGGRSVTYTYVLKNTND